MSSRVRRASTHSGFSSSAPIRSSMVLMVYIAAPFSRDKEMIDGKTNIPYFTRFCNRSLFAFPLAPKGEIRYIKFG